MNVLLSCEESGIARQAFTMRGHNAYSNDLLPSRDGSKYHLQMDCFKAIDYYEWDLIILFPPCTHTCLSGNGTWAGTQQRIEGMNFTRKLWQAAISKCKKVALEQPKTMIGRVMGKPTQRVNLWMFGDCELKETWLWLHGLNPLVADNVVNVRIPTVHYDSPGIRNGLTRAQRRSTLRPGFARAMASQWGNVTL